jgi:uncharacterized membrane-anchored protein YhcB (DUF1043 family)
MTNLILAAIAALIVGIVIGVLVGRSGQGSTLRQRRELNEEAKKMPLAVKSLMPTYSRTGTLVMSRSVSATASRC